MASPSNFTSLPDISDSLETIELGSSPEVENGFKQVHHDYDQDWVEVTEEDHQIAEDDFVDTDLEFTVNMPETRSTMERLDRPSTYAASKNRKRKRQDDRRNDRRGRNGEEGNEREDRQQSEDPDEKLKTATTLYVGNLSFYTTEEQIHELFSKAGEIKRLVMGLDRFQKTPCGFCFVEYYTHQDALDCMKYIGGTKLDERIVRTDLDEGFKEGRQYGRGKSGGQVRDEFRDEFDPGRGGFGRQAEDDY